ncbi:MAG: hypothetical protein DMG08_30310, partial [Acidobacteria bacterium]
MDPATSNKPWRCSFWFLILTQFQGAFNDNAYKFLVILWIASLGLREDARDRLVLVVGALFALPFILFSMAGGYLADRYSKRSVTIGTRASEILVMLVAIAGLSLNSLPHALAAVFLLSAQSAFFGPSKYGLLPELLPENTGQVAGSVMAEAFRGRQAWSGAILLGLSVLGLLCSLGIERVPAANISKKFQLNFLANLLSEIREIRKDRVLFLAVVGNTYFFFLAALLQFNIVFYGTDVLKLLERQNGYLQGAVAIGIGVGSLAAGYLSGNKIEYGLMPLGSIGMSVLGTALYRPGLSVSSIAVNLALLGFFSGFFIVPI